MTTPATKVQTRYVLIKTTSNYGKYQEAAPKGEDDMSVGNFYVNRDCFPQRICPEVIIVTVEEAR